MRAKSKNAMVYPKADDALQQEMDATVKIFQCI